MCIRFTHITSTPFRNVVPRCLEIKCHISIPRGVYFHVLFMLFVFVCVKWYPTHIVLCFCLFFFVLCTLCYKFLCIVHFDCPFGILYRLYY
jgi:hypothetical protein